MVTRFSPERTSRTSIDGKSGVDPILSELCPDARNTHIAFRLDGTFKSITVRTAAGQCFDGEGLAGVASRQVTHTLGPLRGTVVGFRSPTFLQGVAVAGVHMHFIDQDRQAGGHVLALESDGEVDVRVAELWRTVMDLPRNKQFNDARMALDDVGIKAVEG
jgi:alpha-acetolactate decarboxylase